MASDLLIVSSPFIRCVQTAAFLGHGLMSASGAQDAKPTLSVSHNLANRISGKKKYFYEQGLIVTTPSTEVISAKTNDAIQSYQMNQIGETNLIFPGQIEEKPTYKYRVA